MLEKNVHILVYKTDWTENRLIDWLIVSVIEVNLFMMYALIFCSRNKIVFEQWAKTKGFFKNDF